MLTPIYWQPTNQKKVQELVSITPSLVHYNKGSSLPPPGGNTVLTALTRCGPFCVTKKKKSYSFLLHSKLCLWGFILCQGTEVRFSIYFIKKCLISTAFLIVTRAWNCEPWWGLAGTKPLLHKRARIKIQSRNQTQVGEGAGLGAGGDDQVLLPDFLEGLSPHHITEVLSTCLPTLVCS